MRQHPNLVINCFRSSRNWPPWYSMPPFPITRLDGTGYPNGFLTQYQSFARLISIVDAHDAMT